MSSLLTTINERDVFVYSEMQINENMEIAKRNSKRFVCGTVYEGHISRPFSKLIKVDDLAAMNSQYPDTKIVTKGSKSKVTYSMPYTELDV